MSLEELRKLIETLSAERQVAVEEFARMLKAKSFDAATFCEARDEFVRGHPELLQLLAH